MKNNNIWFSNKKTDTQKAYDFLQKLEEKNIIEETDTDIGILSGAQCGTFWGIYINCNNQKIKNKIIKEIKKTEEKK